MGEGRVLDFQRPSLTGLIRELEECGPNADGVIAAWLDDEGHFRISGFKTRNALFLVCGLLDWIKADVLKDMTG